ncbi:MAG: FAD:protein FMN transferase [Dehalococcoidia bacterium]|nr:FAD:protein FMN transferase [Dehalococcoidia bacterium]
MSETYVSTAVFMDTPVSIEVVNPASGDECAERVNHAFDWFGRVEQCCSRFEEQSELRGLSARIGVPVRVSSLLYSVIEFALAVARASNGAFDPTIGHSMEKSGFDRNYRTEQRTASRIDSPAQCSYRDVILDPKNSTVALLRPMVLDLGAVAKGFATDLAAAEISCFKDYSIDAGGDVLVRGRNSEGAPWRIGIAHPRCPDELLCTLHVSDAAVCTSGDYERPRPDGNVGHHIIEPGTGLSPSEVASVTAVAPTAMLADALSTAAFVLGPTRGVNLLECYGVEGLIVSPTMKQYATQGFSRYRN